eukprot:scaffold2987_cov170-Amphora_coffeaeformis.AAC.6
MYYVRALTSIHHAKAPVCKRVCSIQVVALLLQSLVGLVGQGQGRTFSCHPEHKDHPPVAGPDSFADVTAEESERLHHSK